ncbi:MAG: hypothetical protein GWN71_44360, partial [Gammaproteobacteria bacterium]|nr:hypothetical protein [Gammaproteobacteria bacterium]
MFAVTQPLILVAVPLALLVAAHGPRTIAGGVIVAVAVALVLTGQRSSLWWFERGWPLVLGGGYLWMAALRPDWSFSARALATLAFGATLVGGLIAVRPAVWRDLDAAMSRQALQSMTAAVELLGTEVDDTLRTVLRKAATLQSALFPALLGISSL